MQRNTKILAGKIAAGLAVIPILIWAHAAGPDPRHTGAPGDGTCADSGCHLGTPVNGGGGSVVLTSSAGTTYTPGGPAQTITITITDSKAKAYGFQLSARLDSNPVNGGAGDFTVGPQQIILCDSGNLEPSKGCAVGTDTVEFIEHSFPFPKGTINVSWTPPATNVGSVTLYVAANAANGDTTNNGDHIYTTSLKLTPASSGGSNTPTISSGGVVSASAFSAQAGVAAGTWLEIYGSNLSSTTRSWEGSDFSGNNAPISLDGVSVNIGGKSAYVDFISPGQVNVQVPDNIPLGQGVPLVLTNSNGSTTPYAVTTGSLAPALLAPAQAPFMISNRQYVVAQLVDQTFTGMPSHPARPGDVLTIYGIGFGPVTPATPAGTIATQITNLTTSKLTFNFGSTPATVTYQGLAPSNVGLYQFNVQVPPNMAPGDSAITVQIGSFKVNQNLFVNIGH
jgi:uncharacterized protein (TIGR03437 family)